MFLSEKVSIVSILLKSLTVDVKRLKNETKLYCRVIIAAKLWFVLINCQEMSWVFTFQLKRLHETKPTFTKQTKEVHEAMEIKINCSCYN